MILLSHDRSPEKARYSSVSIGGSVMDGKSKKEERPKITGAHVISDTDSKAELLSPYKEDKCNEAKIQT